MNFFIQTNDLSILLNLRKKLFEAYRYFLVLLFNYRP